MQKKLQTFNHLNVTELNPQNYSVCSTNLQNMHVVFDSFSVPTQNPLWICSSRHCPSLLLFKSVSVIFEHPGHHLATQFHHSVWQREHRRPRSPCLWVDPQLREQTQGGGDAGKSCAANEFSWFVFSWIETALLTVACAMRDLSALFCCCFRVCALQSCSCRPCRRETTPSSWPWQTQLDSRTPPRSLSLYSQVNIWAFLWPTRPNILHLDLSKGQGWVKLMLVLV